MDEQEPRNLLLGWCERGPSFSEAAHALADVTPWWEAPEFADQSSDEYRAAMTVFVHTGRTPSLRDAPGSGDGRADLLLAGGAGDAPQLVEVLSTLDARMLDAQKRAADLLRDLNGDDPPDKFIPVSLEPGWEPPLTKKDRTLRAAWLEACARAREEAHTGELSESLRAALSAAFPSLQLGQPRHDELRRGFHLMSLHARVEDRDGRYLDRLSEYLATNKRAVHHVEKLEREQAETGADRLHLYLLVAATGEHGNLLPTSPSWLTEGEFTAPEPLTDIWLDGGTGQVFWWRRETGWTYHDTN